MCWMSTYYQDRKIVSVWFWFKFLFRRRWWTRSTPSPAHYLTQPTNLNYYYPPPTINIKTQTCQLLQRSTHWKVKAIIKATTNEQQNQSINAIRSKVTRNSAPPKRNRKYQKENLIKPPKFHEFQSFKIASKSNQWTQWLKQH
jgi:hypothetical protein